MPLPALIKRQSPRIKPSGVPTIIPGAAPRGLLYCFPLADPSFREIKQGLEPAAKGTTQTFGTSPYGNGLTVALNTTSWISYAINWGTTQPFTLEEVFYITSTTGWTAFGTDTALNLTNSTAAGSVNQWGAAVGTGSATDTYSAIANTGGQFSPNVTVNVGYNHLVFTWNGTTGTLYVNGVSVATLAFSSITATTALMMGGSGGDTSMPGTHLLVNVANVAWTPQEVQQRYANPYGFLSFPQDKITSIIQAGLAAPSGTGAAHATLSKTLANSTAVSTGTVPDHGTLSGTLNNLSGTPIGVAKALDKNALSKTLSGLSISATGIFPRSATLSKTLAALTGASTATNTDHGTLGKTLAATTSSSTGKVTGHATVSDTLGALTSSATDKATDKATLSGTLGSLTSSATENPIDKATLSGTLASISPNLQGHFGAGMATVHATLSYTLAALTGADTAKVTDKATLSKTLAALTGADTGTVPDHLVVSKTLGALALTATGKFPAQLSVNDTLASLGIVATATAHSTHAQLNAVLGLATTSAVLSPIEKATTSQTLATLSIAATGKLQPTRNATANVILSSISSVGVLVDSNKAGLSRTLNSVNATATGKVLEGHGVVSQTLGALATFRAHAQVIEKETLSKTLGNATVVARAVNFPTDHATLSKTLGSVTGTFLTAKTKFTVVNARTHLTVLGYQPGTPPRYNLRIG